MSNRALPDRQTTECPTCGGPVLAVTGDEGTSYYEPAVRLQNRVLERTREVERLRRDLAKWVRAFNRLEKAVTNHVRDCIDADGLAHAHGAVMKAIGPNPDAVDEERDDG